MCWAGSRERHEGRLLPSTTTLTQTRPRLVRLVSPDGWELDAHKEQALAIPKRVGRSRRGSGALRTGLHTDLVKLTGRVSGVLRDGAATAPRCRAAAPWIGLVEPFLRVTKDPKQVSHRTRAGAQITRNHHAQWGTAEPP